MTSVAVNKIGVKRKKYINKEGRRIAEGSFTPSNDLMDIVIERRK